MAAKKQQSKIGSRRKTGVQAPANASQTTKNAGGLDAGMKKENGRLVGLSLAGVLLSIVISFPPLSPFLSTLPVVKPLLGRVRAKKYDAATAVFVRWALTVYLTVLVSAAFVRDRMLASFPFAADAASAVEQALTGSGGPPAGPVYIVVGMLAFAVLGAVSVGIAGCLLTSVALGAAAASTAVLFTHGNNVLLIALVALPPWQWALLVAGAFSFAPAAAWGGWRLLRLVDEEPDRTWLTRRALIVAGLFVLALLLRLTLAFPYLSLVRHWTIP
jgi:hypothetical protein